mmetsp:Transcript_2919/g.9920  ORF Transcript_2919/g.9920 Transcript_2919/m.9920 type:complete len:202 (-) Transcript_2919:141-746(-)
MDMDAAAKEGAERGVLPSSLLGAGASAQKPLLRPLLTSFQSESPDGTRALGWEASASTSLCARADVATAPLRLPEPSVSPTNAPKKDEDAAPMPMLRAASRMLLRRRPTSDGGTAPLRDAVLGTLQQAMDRLLEPLRPSRSLAPKDARTGTTCPVAAVAIDGCTPTPPCRTRADPERPAVCTTAWCIANTVMGASQAAAWL